MCNPARCAKCGKTTWAGCGQHIDAVMREVPAGERCVCAEVPDDDLRDFGCRPQTESVRAAGET